MARGDTLNSRLPRLTVAFGDQAALGTREALATRATSDASFINVSIKNSPRLVPHQPQLLKSRNEEELWGPNSPCPPAVEVLKEHLRSTHLRDFPYLRLQTPSKGLALLIFLSVQEDVPLPQLQHQRPGSVCPL